MAGHRANAVHQSQELTRSHAPRGNASSDALRRERRFAAERRGLHSHAERGNEGEPKSFFKPAYRNWPRTLLRSMSRPPCAPVASAGGSLAIRFNLQRPKCRAASAVVGARGPQWRPFSARRLLRLLRLKPVFQKTQNSPAKFRAQRAENLEKRRLDSTSAVRQRR